MAYRSELHAALARIDTMGERRPCPTCARRRLLFWKGVDIVGSIFFGLIALAVVVVATLTIVLMVAIAMMEPMRFG